MVTEFLQDKEQKTDTLWYDAENGKMVPTSSLKAGYNKAVQNNIAADGAVVAVTITLKSNSEEVDQVTATWVGASSDK